MIELKLCCKVPFPDKLFEGYEIKDNTIIANVNASKVMDMMRCFIEMHEEPMFFILEIPSNAYDGESEHKWTNDPGDDVYYADGLDKESALRWLDGVGNFLIKDGLNTFGFAGHESNDEILFGKYNVMTFYTRNPSGFANMFKKFEIPEMKDLVTAWDTFDREHPGECSRYESNGKTIYDIPEAYKEFGLYFYEKRKYDGEGHINEITLEELVGKIILVGITYYTHENDFIEQKQLYGRVIEANKSLIRIEQNNGESFTIPSDLRSTQRARPGEYRLRSTGEVVVDPDFLSTWNLIKGE